MAGNAHSPFQSAFSAVESPIKSKAGELTVQQNGRANVLFSVAQIRTRLAKRVSWTDQLALGGGADTMHAAHCE